MVTVLSSQSHDCKQYSGDFLASTVMKIVPPVGRLETRHVRTLPRRR